MFEIKFANVEQINIVLQALSKMPYEISASIIEDVRTQAEVQFTEQQAVSTETNDNVTDAVEVVN